MHPVDSGRGGCGTTFSLRVNLTFQTSPSNRVIAFAKELRDQIKTRFQYDQVPDPDGYVAIDLIAQWLDPRTKKMLSLSGDSKDAVTAEIKRYPPS